MHSLNRDQIATLEAVVTAGSFEAAAALLHVSQPAVSQRIKALEQQVGRVLLKRGRPLEPTDSGRVLMRHARQLGLLESEVYAELGLTDDDGSRPLLTIVVNADSLATWFMDALVAADHTSGLDVEVRREDEFHATRHLADGTVMAAVTARPHEVRGCTTRRLGSMRYVACASPDFVDRHFPTGPTTAALRRAPVLTFDDRDQLQSRFHRRVTRHDLEAPRRFVPATGEYLTGVRRGLGWGLLPEQQCADLVASGELLDLWPGRHLDVPLYWQTWRVAPAALDALGSIVVDTAALALRQGRR
jgi:LysR family transcriptional regulator (chromosome initiation inhibitor)